MTDLQTSLMAIGGAIVAGVISYNKWQEYKAKKSVERAFSSSPDDVLMRESPEGQAERHEPVFVPHDQDEHEQSQHATSETSAITRKQAQSQAALSRDSARNLPVDPMVDCVIPLAMETPLRGEKILPVLQSLRYVGNKPVHFIGQREADGEWETVAHGNTYAALQTGVQLANRSGALNELEYSDLVMRLRQVADELNAEPDVPDMMRVMSAARDLHQFVGEYDAQLSINVQANKTSWPINTLLAALERQGFDLRPDGRLVMPDGEGGILFSLLTNVTLASETTSRLTLLLDVPRVSPSYDGFGAMTACARSLAARLDGTVVDDGNQPLSDAALNQIADQVRAFYADMETAEIPAGSARALRLFS